MGSGRTYLVAFVGLHQLDDADERRRVARQGLAMLAQIAETEPAPLEGLPSDQLLDAVRIAFEDGVLAELEWMSPAASAIALFELAQALPPGPERRELGRRVLTRLRDADRATFVRLLVALARSSPRLLSSDGLRARAAVVLSAPLTAPGAIGELALGLLAQPTLAASWIEQPATGSLPDRRLAARILAHGAREAVRRFDGGDRGGVAVMARSGTRVALDRLLGDREALVWRFASIARGMLAHVDPELAADIDRELRPTASSTELRRGGASAAAALERGGAAARWVAVLMSRAATDPGIARGAILGLAGLAVSKPIEADQIATELVALAPLDAAEAIAELRREERAALVPAATTIAIAWTRQQLADPASDDGRWALLHALDAELADPTHTSGVGVPTCAARAALDAGDVPAALAEARRAIEEVVAAADWLERATDDDPIDRRHSMRLLRELDRELLADNTLTAVLALAPDADPARAAFARALASIERSLLAREADPEPGTVAHGGLRIARLRALVRLLDGVRSTDDGELGSRLEVVRTLMNRAAGDHSSLRRAVWAALTRAGDALLRDDHAEVTDLLLVWTMAFPDDDFAIVRQASMLPEVVAVFDAYAALQQATWAAADPDDHEKLCVVVERIGELADALPPERSPRVESVRLAIARIGTLLGRITGAASQATIPTGTLDRLGGELGALARRAVGGHHRLGLPYHDASLELEQALRSITAVLGPATGRRRGMTTPPTNRRRGATTISPVRELRTLDEVVAVAIDTGRGVLPPVLAAAIERVLLWLASRPHTTEAGTAPSSDAMLPGWVPLSRMLGAFHVLRPIGRGVGGSVLLAVRAEERTRADRELVAVKVPDYSGAAARSLSEHEFEALFRQEAGALLALPAHPNLARFITFDASARPKPLLVMEFVRGATLERTIDHGELDMPAALAIIDGLLAGLAAMHEVQIAHLDVKPANVVLRETGGDAVLVDFGLAGRTLRTGCGSAHFGAAEVWLEGARDEPFGADVYAATCVAFEILTTAPLIGGTTLNEVLAGHFANHPGAAALDALRAAPGLDHLAELLRAGVARQASRRPTAARLRAGFAALAPELAHLTWPIG